jgi:phosphoglycolate phosphatase
MGEDVPVLLPLTVGFDLDMTLVDSREGIAATFRAVSARTGVPVDVDLVVSRLGPPLELELAHWFPAREVTATASLYRSLYRHHAILTSPSLPGAVEAVAAVGAAGGAVVVVTAKNEPDARRHLAHLGLAVADVVGLAWGEGKAAALRECGAGIYVGDHVADMSAGRSAGARPVGVATGPCTVDDLYAAGAETVLDDLTAFPEWFSTTVSGHLPDLGRAAPAR